MKSQVFPKAVVEEHTVSMFANYQIAKAKEAESATCKQKQLLEKNLTHILPGLLVTTRLSKSSSNILAHVFMRLNGTVSPTRAPAIIFVYQRKVQGNSPTNSRSSLQIWGPLTSFQFFQTDLQSFLRSTWCWKGGCLNPQEMQASTESAP